MLLTTEIQPLNRSAIKKGAEQKIIVIIIIKIILRHKTPGKIFFTIFGSRGVGDKEIEFDSFDR